MSTAKVSTYRAPDAIIDQKAGYLENGHDSLDNLIIQAIGNKPFVSFSLPGESPIQWIQFLHALDRQGSGKRGSEVDNTVGESDNKSNGLNGLNSFASETKGIKEAGNILKGSSVSAWMTESSSEDMRTIKMPEAVIAFAQAAAKANGACEKYLPGWPFVSPSKLQLQKCDKCCREFCSPINYRRHIRVHRRSLNVNKVSPKSRELLGAFWDKLSKDEAMELAAIKHMTLEEVSGSSIIIALASLLRKPGFSSLPQVYLKAGATLLDVVECRPSMFPIASQELFGVLDDASEKTFLCAGTAISLQRFVFDGQIGKIATEMKNLIACTSFLLELKLVKAWLASKDAEALRCQKLLFEEEEAAQKRQTELLERRRMKKLRQKDQKMKEQLINKSGSEEGLRDAVEDPSCSVETLRPMVPSEAGLTVDLSLYSSHLGQEDSQSCTFADEAHNPETEYAEQYLKHQAQQETAERQPTLLHQSMLKLTRNDLGGFHSQIAATKPMAGQKHNSYKDPKPTSLVNSQKIWTRKSKFTFEAGDIYCREIEKEMRDRSYGIESHKVLIGSISITLDDCNDHPNSISVRQDNVQEPVKIDCTLCGVNQTPVKLIRHVNREEDGAHGTVQSDNREADIDESPGDTSGRILPDQSCLTDCGMSGFKSEMTTCSLVVPEVAELPVLTLFSSKVAVDFLSQRWRKALSSDDVVLVMSPDTEAGAMDDLDISGESCVVTPDVDIYVESGTVAPLPSISCPSLNHLGSREGGIPIERTSPVTCKPKFRAKPEKSTTD